MQKKALAKIIAERLRYFREEAGMSQGDLQQKSGICRTWISSIETGKRNPSIYILYKLVYGMGISFETFFRKH